MRKNIIIMFYLFIPIISSWSFTMYLIPHNGGRIVQIGNIGNNYWRLPNIQKEDFGFWGSYESYDTMVRPDKEQWKVIEKTIKQFGPTSKNGVAFKCYESFSVIIFNDYYNGDYITADNFLRKYDDFRGSYYEWYVFKDQEKYDAFINKLMSTEN